MSKVDVEKPNKRNIERLFRELSGYNNPLDDACPSKEEMEKADRRVDEIEKKMYASGPLAYAVQVRDDARDEFNKERKKLQERLSKIRRLYFARGLTPMVLKQIEEFVDMLNRQ